MRAWVTPKNTIELESVSSPHHPEDTLEFIHKLSALVQITDTRPCCSLVQYRSHGFMYLATWTSMHLGIQTTSFLHH